MHGRLTMYEINGHKNRCMCHDCTQNRMRVLADNQRRADRADRADAEWSDDQQDHDYQVRAVNRVLRLPKFFSDRIIANRKVI